MNSYYTFIFFTFILLLSNSSLAYRIYPYHYEQYQENVSPIKMMMVVPAGGDIIWPQYVVPSMNQVPDERLRRGWGSGRRRRSVRNGN